MRKIENPEQEFFKRIKPQPNGCWDWTNRAADGYGRFNYNGKNILAHRYMYKLFKGEIPKGLEIDHLCRNHSCVNPAHLEAVTHKENLHRGLVGAPKEYCKSGLHRMVEGNIYYVGTGRLCMKCDNIRHRRYYWRDKAFRKLVRLTVIPNIQG